MSAGGYGGGVERLGGGSANAGRVFQDGHTVRRPLPANASTLHALLRHLRAASAIRASLPVGVDGDVEVLEFIPGEVALAPFPAWASTDKALITVAGVLRQLHDATASWTPPAGASWSTALADPAGGPVICHNDVCVENVVFRGGRAAALIDFDFAAPGRRVWDVVMAARYWVPLTDPALPPAVGLGVDDPIARLRTFVDAYRLGDADRRIVAELLLQAEETARRFVTTQASRGAPAFVEMWDDGARAHFDRKLEWIYRHGAAITEALTR